ncbi:MAG: glycosyltransferase family 2 protein [Sedimentisphaerales bacterium]|nr:glycosyltransferase family 2 protein [Sedimentisphaerales bacterium]
MNNRQRQANNDTNPTAPPSAAGVDIVMPLYNKARCVIRAVESIRRQSYPHWRLIVVDDGSTDDGPDRVRALADPRIELIRQANAGPGPARNAGIEHARHELLAFLDADDEWYPWYLANAVRALEQDRQVGLVATMYYEWPRQEDMTGHWARRGIRPGIHRLTGREEIAWAESFLLFFHVDTSLMRTKTARRYGGFYAAKRCLRGEDTTFFMRLGLNETVKIITPAAVRRHREDSDLALTEDFALLPCQEDPGQVLDYCREPWRRELGQRVIEYLSLRTVHHWARSGYRDRAVDLLGRFEGARRFRKKYFRCRLEIALSGVLPYWVRLKCAVGPRVRLWLGMILQTLRLKKAAPDITADQDRTSDG